MLTQKEIPKFKSWLVSQGAEILPQTNEFEVIRFRCRIGTGVVYRNSKGKHSVSGPLVSDAYDAYKSCSKWVGKGKPTKRLQGSKKKRELLDRDGDQCFYCGFPLGSDITLEHLVAVNQGGPDRIENMVLAHERCNQEAGNLSVMDKVRLRERMHEF